MAENHYELLALAARYWFALLGVLIVLRAYAWLWHDHREKHRRLKSLPDAGCIGVLTVLHGSEELPEGTSLPVEREGTLGYLRSCDLIVPVPGVRGIHLDCSFEEGRGLIVVPRRRCVCRVDGEEVASAKAARTCPVTHGALLEVGECVMRFEAFEGINIPRTAMLRPFRPEPEEKAEQPRRRKRRGEHAEEA